MVLSEITNYYQLGKAVISIPSFFRKQETPNGCGRKDIKKMFVTVNFNIDLIEYNNISKFRLLLCP